MRVCARLQFLDRASKCPLPLECSGSNTVQLEIAGTKSDITVAALGEFFTMKPPGQKSSSTKVHQAAPTVVRRDQLQSLVSTTPGWNTENDGLMIRGVDDGTLRGGRSANPGPGGRLVSGSFNTDTIASLEVITGNIPAEFGDRSGAVVVIQPKSGFNTPLNGTLSLGGGAQLKGYFHHTRRGNKQWGLFFAGSGHQSDRFLDPVDPRNFNNVGGDVSLDLRADWRASEKDTFRLAGSLQGANFRMPNNEDQEAAGQRQRQEVRHDHESIAWQHNWSANTLSDVAYFRNFFHPELNGSPFDTPLTANQNRHQTRQGVVASLTHITHGHTIKAGVETSRVRSLSFLGLPSPTLTPRRKPTSAMRP